MSLTATGVVAYNWLPYHRSSNLAKVGYASVQLVHTSVLLARVRIPRQVALQLWLAGDQATDDLALVSPGTRLQLLPQATEAC